MSFRIVAKSILSNPGNQGQKTSRLLKAIGWQIWKRVVRSSRQITLANGRKFTAHPDCVVSSALIYAAWPEFDELQFLRRLLNNDDVLIDIGANVGHIGLLMSDRVRPQNILAFEPTPVTFDRLTKNWTLNGFPTDLLFNMAVGEAQKEVLFANLSHPGTMNSQVTDSNRSTDTCVIQLRPLDSFRDLWHDKPIGLIKIDVEGFELDVFRGAQQTLLEDRPRLIMFESLDGRVNAGIEEILKNCRYQLFQLDEVGKPNFQSASAQNVFALPIELIPSVA